MTKNIYTIPGYYDFMAVLAGGIPQFLAANNFPLHAAMVLLPNRRSLRVLQDQFLERNHGQPLLLPRLLALGETDEAELLLRAEDAALPQALPPESRQCLLVEKILAWSKQALSFTQAWHLAQALGALLDQIYIEELPLSALPQLVPDDYAEHWQEIIFFLEILWQEWPETLARLGVMDAKDRQIKLLRRQAAFWAQHPPQTPVIAAGSTASVKAVADLLSIIAGLPQGLVLLPGLDSGLDEASQSAVDYNHPQHYLHRFCQTVGRAAQDIPPWPLLPPPTQNQERENLWREIMRPAAASADWAESRLEPSAAQNLQLLETDTEQDQARMIALLLRETLLLPEKTAMLVTADRDLAQIVLAQLRRLGIAANDSAGEDFLHQPPGQLLWQLAAIIQQPGAVENFLGLLDQILCRCQSPRQDVLSLGRRLEKSWRAASLPSANWLLAENSEKFLAAAQLPLWRNLQTLIAGLPGMDAPISGQEFLRQVFLCAETISRDETGDVLLWHGEAGEELTRFFTTWHESLPFLPAQTGAAWALWLQQELAATVFRPRLVAHPRLQILGPLEARLHTAHRVIIAGLDEGSWPPQTEADPWLSRPLRAEFGLPARERRIGQSAHDLTQLAQSGAEVFLLRSRRRFGENPLPSRFWVRAKTVLEANNFLAANTARAAGYLHWLQIWDQPPKAKPAPAPQPAPPIAARPREFYVTQIELWQRNPYGFYAKHILRLRPLPQLAAIWDAAERGNLLHSIAEKYHQLQPAPDNFAQMHQQWQNIAQELLAEWQHDPFVRHVWQPRLRRILHFLAATEYQRYPVLHQVLTEETWVRPLSVEGRDYIIRAKTDRVDIGLDGQVRIIDYKSGSLPKPAERKSGMASQLPLSAAILQAAKPELVIADLEFWLLHGKDAGGEIKSFGGDPAATATAAWAGLARLIAQYQNPAQPYPANPWGTELNRHDDYAHLARLAEWGDAEDAA